jgi:hypothetical protein
MGPRGAVGRAAGHAAARAIAIAIAIAATGCSVRLKYTGGARPVGAAELGEGWLRAAPTPVVRQQAQRDCGLAALAMVAGAWGLTWKIDELAQQVEATEHGVKLAALRDLARARGLEAYAIRGAQADLERELAQGRPVLLGLVLPFQLDRALGHYEVAVALDPRDGSVVTLDPATGRWLRRTRQVLDAEWEPAGRATLVVVGPRAGPNAAIRAQGRHDSVAADGQATRVQRDADRAHRHHRRAHDVPHPAGQAPRGASVVRARPVLRARDEQRGAAGARLGAAIDVDRVGARG